TIKERLEVFFEGMEENIHSLTASSSFRRLINKIDDHEALRSSPITSDLLAEFMAFAERKPIFYQIKFIDFDGDEIFAITQAAGGYRIVPEKELNKTGTNFYLYLARETPPNKAVFIPVELKGNRNELIPGISCIYTVYDSGFSGILVFQIYARSFFKIVEQETPHSPEGTVMLVNADGYYLYHSEKKKDWNQLLATKEILNLKADYGEGKAQQLLSRASFAIQELDKEMVAYAPLFTDHAGLENKYTVLKSVSKSEIFAPVNTFKKLFFGLLGFYLLTSLTLAYLATQQFTRPIQRLRRETEGIAKGDYHARVDVRTYDEIEELAHQFNVMAESLEQREEEIFQHRLFLEQKVQERTRELEDEKDKLKIILDNVPSGFILLDKNYKILTASAALRTITGKPVESLIGKTCNEVIGNGHICSGCPTERVFRSGEMEMQQVQRLGADSEERFLEHISVPLKRNGQVETVLEIITDITERKRLQDQLIRSERLAATGEIAAVIAHEMRNSLTSVRMIIQLLAESKVLGQSDCESLDVALDSLGSMERIVNDLLQLARPTQLERRMDSINDILLDSIEFAKHQITRHGIVVETELSGDLPEVALDRSQMKKAVVNLILNASQAVEGHGTIKIRSGVTTLTKNFRDLGEVRTGSDEKVSLGVQEVVLKKGERVLTLAVEDTGCGIPPAQLERIFDPFFTTKINGTGLGLSFVKRVINEHGGLVTVTSHITRGTCFSILLPT
ncbi:MAG: PAS domain-containing protein, partial [Aliifodinibius sp.]|nr:PAS domain-containing protein [candidate division KSB1 bacterium]NIV12626.1 PAS domain-containing protein [Fodinibius sp.]NIR71618.1 PAS domain-containing protein [candidate division KSB1 bacterium]NIS24846.1 PAS domain-containing protein [candidate division KSB1 bacterium]NIU25486.1 PAS domain-containing protein [candidate division KSB1 bacterium]